MTRTLEQRIQYLEDVQQIRNLFSSIAYREMSGDVYEQDFSHERPDVRFEIEVFGVTDGQESMRKHQLPRPPAAATGSLPPNAGRMSTHYESSYVIVVAGDGKTAQATCLSPGHVTGAGTLVAGKFSPMWSFCRFGVDFVKDSTGKWKFWHEHIFTVFNSIYYTKSWVQRSADRSLMPSSAAPKDSIPRMADRGTTIDAPFALNAPPRFIPHLPVAYGVFEETMSYIPPPAPMDL